MISMRTRNFPSQSTVPWNLVIIWCDCQHESILHSYVELILPNLSLRFIVKAEAENEVSSVWSNELLVFVYEEISGVRV